MPTELAGLAKNLSNEQVTEVVCALPVIGPKVAILSKRKSILVVDDDPSMRLGMERLLSAHGFNTRSFASADALLHHGDFGEAFCIILDIDLNGESGIDLRLLLADNEVKLPVIYVTGNDSDVNRAAAVGSGCVAYLTKPFTSQSLIESIERVDAALT